MKKEIFLRLSLATVVRWLQPKKVILLILLILAVGSFLRIYDVGAESLWLDEAKSVEVSALNAASIIEERVEHSHLPLYFVTLHFWVKLFGTSEAAVRAPSAIFGTLSVLTTFWVGCALFNRKVGLISGFLSAISLFHIQYSQEARPYALLLLLSLLSFLFFIQILKQDKKWYYPYYLLANVFLAYTHVFGFFIIAAQTFFLLLFWTKYRPHRFKLLSMQAATIIAILPLMFLLYRVVISMIERGGKAIPSLMSIYEMLYRFAGRQDLLVIIFLCLVVLAPLSITIMKGKWSLRKPVESLKGMSRNIRLEAIEEIVLLVIWLLSPIVLAFIVSKTIVPIYLHRCVIGASPALYLLVAKGLTNLKVKKVIYPMLLIIVLLATPDLVNYYTQYQKAQWREVAEFVELNVEENDVFIFYPPFTRQAFYYYDQAELVNWKSRIKIPIGVEDTEEIAALVNKGISEKKRLWVMLTSMGGRNPPIETYLIDRYGDDSIIIEKEFVGVHMLLIELRQAN